MRLLKTKYQGICKRCNNKIDIDTEVYYEKSMGIFCIGCEPKNEEETRYYRQLKVDKKKERLIKRADKLEAEAESKMTEFNSHRGDHAFMFQPGRIPYRDKVVKRYDKGMEMLNEAKETREKAENYHVRVKGDAEKERQAERDKQDKIIIVNTPVYDFCFGIGIVMKVNKKTYTIKFDDGNQFTRDKTFVKIK